MNTCEKLKGSLDGSDGRFRMLCGERNIMGHKSLEVLVPKLNSKRVQDFREPNLNLSSHGK